MNDLSCGIKMWARVSYVLSQCMRLTVFAVARYKQSKRTEECLCSVDDHSLNCDEKPDTSSFPTIELRTDN